MRFLIIMLTIIAFSGCAAAPPMKADSNLSMTGASATKSPVTIHFGTPLIVRFPKNEPVSVEDYIRCGLFLFDECRYKEADEAFKKAREKIADPPGDLFRACLISSAVCELLLNDKARFVNTVRVLKSTYNPYELLYVKRYDPRCEVIFNLYDKFIQTGNY